MGDALAAADLVVVTEVYAAREAPVPGVSGAQVATAAGNAGIRAIFEPDRNALADRVVSELRAGDVVLTLGAGDITRLGPALRARLAPA
jgi:UDP-N-acetylmuramate--alanine ligase